MSQKNIYNEIYLWTKYIKSLLWRVAERLYNIEGAWCINVNLNFPSYWLILHTKIMFYY